MEYGFKNLPRRQEETVLFFANGPMVTVMPILKRELGDELKAYRTRKKMEACLPAGTIIPELVPYVYDAEKYGDPPMVYSNNVMAIVTDRDPDMFTDLAMKAYIENRDSGITIVGGLE